MKITIEREGKEAKVFETNGFALVANFNEHVLCTISAERLSVEDMGNIIYSLKNMLSEVKKECPEAAKLADIKSALEGLAESCGEDLDDDKEADNDAGRV